jgi:perosamine synthetase
MNRFIPVSQPALVGNEKKYVLDCLETNWISSIGKYIEQFEEAFASFCGVKHAVSCCNGTAALHVALLAMGVGPGDEVIVPTLTFVATANSVTYCGARPVMVDSEPETWNIDPTKLKKRITSRTKGIIAVHLYGHPANMDPILGIAKKHNLFVLEDAAEAHGAEYKKIKVGSLGDIAVFSFYGNKIITTGEGGMVVTNDPTIADGVRRLKGQGMDPDRRYWFPTIGYNYRMSNIAAAIGLAQLEKVDYHMARRREIADHYIKELAQTPGISIQPEKDWARNVYWMTSAVLEENLPITRDDLMTGLAEAGIETRPFFYPMHALPMYQKDVDGVSFPVADRLAKNGLNLPSSATLSHKDVSYVCSQIIRILGRNHRPV